MAQDLATWIREKSTRSMGDIPLMVHRIATEGDVSVLGRLSDLGLASGEVISYFGRAPLGEPIYICVRETVVALRLEEASLIHISEGGAV